MIAAGPISGLPSAVVPFVAALGYLAWRYRWLILGSRRDSAFLPANAPRPARAARVAEATMIVVLGPGVTIGIMESYSGVFRHWDVFTPEAIRLHFVLTAGCIVVVLAGALLTAFGRSTFGVLLAAGTVMVYTSVVAGPLRSIRNFVQVSAGIGARPYTFRIEPANLPGADLWVNGVYLGQTPCRITIDDLLAKIPVWTGIPPEFNTPEFKRPSKEIYPQGAIDGEHSQWTLIGLPTPAQSDPLGRFIRYYARARFAGEWGYACPSRTLNINAGQTISINLTFPKRAARLAALINQARLTDYHVGPAWFAAAETYGQEITDELLAGLETEPQFAGLLDDWASFRYGLANVNNADDAWRVFERICADAQRDGVYSTAALPGRAVEALVPRLDPERLVARAEEFIASTDAISWSTGEIAGQFHFGTAPRSDCTLLDESRSRGPGPASLSPGAFPVAHAIWRLDQLLDARDDTTSNIVEQRITPLVVRYHYRDELVMQIACRLGGDDLDKFLGRHDWRRTPSGNRIDDYENMLSLIYSDVNRWFYLLAHLHDAAGAGFRAANQQEVLRLARRLVEGDSFDREQPEFLFLDLSAGNRSLAAQFWPTYGSLLVARHGRMTEPAPLWKYLVKMEPVSTLDMYLDVWRAHHYGFPSGAIAVLRPLPPARRIEILTAVRAEAARGLSALTLESDVVEKHERQEWIRNINEALVDLGVRDAAADVLEQLRNSSAASFHRQARAVWLEQKDPTSGLVAAFADAPEPEIRILVMGALRVHASPAHHAVLEKLLTDPDANVRQAAEGVRADLDRLAATPPAELASLPPTTQSAPAE